MTGLKPCSGCGRPWPEYDGECWACWWSRVDEALRDASKPTVPATTAGEKGEDE